MTDPDTIRAPLTVPQSWFLAERQSRRAAEARLRTLETALRGLEFKHGCWCVDGESPEGHELACQAARAALAAAETPGGAE